MKYFGYDMSERYGRFMLLVYESWKFMYASTLINYFINSTSFNYESICGPMKLVDPLGFVL